MEELFQDIYDSSENGQFKQMVDQIDEFNDLSTIFTRLWNYGIETYGSNYVYKNFHRIVINYHSIKYR